MGSAVDNLQCCIIHCDVVTEPLHPCLRIPKNTAYFLARDHHPKSWEGNTAFFLHLMAPLHLHIPITLYNSFCYTQERSQEQREFFDNKTFAYSPISKYLQSTKEAAWYSGFGSWLCYLLAFLFWKTSTSGMQNGVSNNCFQPFLEWWPM